MPWYVADARAVSKGDENNEVSFSLLSFYAPCSEKLIFIFNWMF